ncbi:51_t:CDS:2 [Funneliformis geosporum]|nr:51_t:CDS:2 [Funneliformis geosporum]
MPIQVTRETRQAFKINQIDDSLTQMKGQNIIKINIPDLEKVDKHIREAIHNNYNAQIIDCDIFIKYDGGNKEGIQADLMISARAQNPIWWVTLNTICVAGGNDYRPDVGIWFQAPTFAQRQNPLVNSCPPPNVYIEVFYNQDPERANALTRIAQVQQSNPTIEFVGVALPELVRPYHQNPNPGVASIPATPVNNQNQRPNRAPYLIHWNANNIPAYYRIDWNEHLILMCGWTLQMNIVLSILSRP